MAMVNLGNVSAISTQMLGNDLGAVVASGVSNLLNAGGEQSLAGALSQMEKFFGPSAAGKLGGTSIASGPMAFSMMPGAGGATPHTTGLSNPFGATQGAQPRMEGMMQGLGRTLDGMNQQLGLQSDSKAAALPAEFEKTMDQAVRLQLAGDPASLVQSRTMFERAMGMLSATPSSQDAQGVAGSGAGTLSFAPVSSGGGSASPGISAGGGVGGGLDAMMAQAENLLRSDSMEAQLAGQRMMQKALRMFELLSKLIEKQSEMASKAIAAIK